MTVLPYSLGLVKLGREVIKKKKLLLEEVDALQRTFSVDMEAWKSFEKEWTR